MEMKITDDISGSNGLDPEYVPVYRALIAGDPSCLLHTDSDNRTRCFCCAKIEELTPEALDVVSVVLEACRRLRVCEAWVT
jgi:hypothetical protein